MQRAMHIECEILESGALRRFVSLSPEAANTVTNRFYAFQKGVYGTIGEVGQAACRRDLTHHLEFLRPALEFGLLYPFVDYLDWVGSFLKGRGVDPFYLDRSLVRLGEFFVERMPDAEGEVVAAAVTAALKLLRANGGRSQAQFQRSEPWSEATEFLAALIRGDRSAASEVVDRCLDSGRPLVEVESHVMEPALFRIGEEWQANRISVAAEHMASGIVQSIMTVALSRLPVPPRIGKRVLLACVQGNQHAIGLRMVGDSFHLAGWEVLYLGADVPTAALERQVLASKPDLIGLSVSFPAQLSAVRDIIAILSERMGDARPSIIIGGLAVNRFDRLAGRMGADAAGRDGPTTAARATEASSVDNAPMPLAR